MIDIKEYMELNSDLMLYLKVAIEISEKTGYLNLKNSLKKEYDKLQDIINTNEPDTSEPYSLKSLVMTLRQLEKEVSKKGLYLSSNINLFQNYVDFSVYTKTVTGNLNECKLRKCVYGLCYSYAPKRMMKAIEEIRTFINNYNKVSLEELKKEEEALRRKLAKTKESIKKIKEGK